MDDLLGQLVVSLAGRDKNSVCAIVGISEETGYVYVADGKLRKVETPKKKKLKHIKLLETEKLPVEKLTNRYIREAVNSLCEGEKTPI